MTAEERKKTPPRTGGEDVVFAEDAAESFNVETDDGEYEVVKGEDGQFKIKRLADGKTGDPRGNVYKLANSISELSKMEAVATLNGTELNDRSKRASEQINEYFNSIGGKVEREGLGEVLLDKYGADSTAAKDHHPTRMKIMAVHAVPEVIKKGKQISFTDDHHGTPSYIFAAPVDFLGKKVYVAAVVNEVTVDENGVPVNKYYLDEVVDAKGFRFNIVKEDSDTTKADHRTRSTDNGGSESSSAKTVPLTASTVNSEEVGAMSAERRLSVEESMACCISCIMVSANSALFMSAPAFMPMDSSRYAFFILSKRSALMLCRTALRPRRRARSMRACLSRSLVGTPGTACPIQLS